MTLPFQSDTIVKPVNDGHENSQLSPLLRVIGTELTGQSLSGVVLRAARQLLDFVKNVEWVSPGAPLCEGDASSRNRLARFFLVFFSPLNY